MGGAQGHPRSGHYWPTAAEVQLLRAALLDGETALAAWRQWQALADIDRLDVGSERLVPLLAYNLKRCGVEQPPLGRYDGLFHYTWVANQRRLAHTARAVRIFQEAGMPSMLLKGMALAAHVYRHLGLRPMDDVDLLVPTADAPRAMDLLRSHGWRPSGPDSDLATRHARLFVADDRSAHIDLHWHALWELTGQGADDELWARAEAARLGDVPVRVLGATDLFLQVVVHGARWNDVPSLRWAADAMTILMKAGPAVDWPLLIAQAKRHAFMLPVGLALEWLVDALDAPVPPAVLAAFAAHRPSAFERVEQRAREWTSPRVGSLPLVICHHIRVTRARGPLAIAAGLPRYLQGAYGLPTLGQLPAALYTRVANRLRGSASRRVSS